MARDARGRGRDCTRRRPRVLRTGRPTRTRPARAGAPSSARLASALPAGLPPTRQPGVLPDGPLIAALRTSPTAARRWSPGSCRSRADLSAMMQAAARPARSPRAPPHRPVRPTWRRIAGRPAIDEDWTPCGRSWNDAPVVLRGAAATRAAILRDFSASLGTSRDCCADEVSRRVALFVAPAGTRSDHTAEISALDSGPTRSRLKVPTASGRVIAGGAMTCSGFFSRAALHGRGELLGRDDRRVNGPDDRVAYRRWPTARALPRAGRTQRQAISPVNRCPWATFGDHKTVR